MQFHIHWIYNQSNIQGNDERSGAMASVDGPDRYNSLLWELLWPRETRGAAYDEYCLSRCHLFFMNVNSSSYDVRPTWDAISLPPIVYTFVGHPLQCTRRHDSKVHPEEPGGDKSAGSPIDAGLVFVLWLLRLCCLPWLVRCSWVVLFAVMYFVVWLYECVNHGLLCIMQHVTVLMTWCCWTYHMVWLFTVRLMHYVE